MADLAKENWSLLGKWSIFGCDVEGLWKRVVCEKYHGGRMEVKVTILNQVRYQLSGDIISIESSKQTQNFHSTIL